MKTRLTPVLQAREAADLATALLLDTVGVGTAAGMETVVAFTPARGRRPLERLLGAGARLLPQGSGDLGERLERVLAQLDTRGRRALVAVGTDCPAVGPRRLREAAAALERFDLVLGPALDGGFYLLGMRRARGELFRDIPWSTEHVASAVMARARAGGLTVETLPTERDLDTPEDVYELFVTAREKELWTTYPRTWDALNGILPPRRLAALEAAIRGER